MLSSLPEAPWDTVPDGLSRRDHCEINAPGPSTIKPKRNILEAGHFAGF